MLGIAHTTTRLGSTRKGGATQHTETNQEYAQVAALPRPRLNPEAYALL